ncbi:hypothetical protein, partial [Pseudomonas sp. NMI795_08]|uniref:hypothetical protein n=1 Tax=Pseudomonas sp. NMI795_08 TaxID=2903144 RepID=UPI001E3919CE
ALLAELPPATERAELERIAGEAKAVFNDAVRVGDAARADLALLGWDAVVYRLNGDTFFGCDADDGSRTHLLKHLAAKPGQVPGWGQDGEWLTEVQGLRIRVKARNWMHGGTSLDLFAVDLDQPYLSPTGFRAHSMDARQWHGYEFGTAVRLEIERQLPHKDWQLKPIAAEDRAFRAEHDLPAWLAPALEGVTRNGQQALPLSGRAPVELPSTAPTDVAEPKAPMSNKDRQKAFRRRQKEKREQAKAEGRRTFELSDTDLAQLWLAMNTHIAFKKPLDWQMEGFRELAGRLFAHEHAAYIERLGLDAEGVNNLNKQRDKQAKQGWDAYHAERKRTASLLDKANDLQAENGRLKAALAEIGDVMGGAAPLAKAAPAPEVAEVAALQAEVARLRAQLDKQHNDNLNTIAELGRALHVTQAMQDRLKAAGLPDDYRQYLG